MKLLTEPLLHFVVVGALLFGGYSWLNDTRADPTAIEPVRIGEGDVRWLKQTWSSQWLREPTADELKGLVDDLLKEKLMAREAEAMGLGEDDTIIHRIETVTPMVSHPTGDAMVQTWRMRTLDPLAAQTVLIDGLQNTMTDALVRVALANGNSWTARLTPSEPSAVIPDEEMIR